jgi:hypothetical protein
MKVRIVLQRSLKAVEGYQYIVLTDQPGWKGQKSQQRPLKVAGDCEHTFNLISS